jgi:hypothetical protein
MISEAGEKEAEVAAIGVGPSVVARNAGDETARELIIAAGLDAAQDATRIVGPFRLSKGDAAGIMIEPLLVRLQAANVTADVAASPAEAIDRIDRSRRRCPVHGPAHIRRHGGSRDQRCESNRGQENLLHRGNPRWCIYIDMEGFSALYSKERSNPLVTG